MPFCVSCGTETPPGNKFCANCGRPVGPAAETDPAPPPQQPPPPLPPPGPPSARTAPTIDWRLVVVGNWFGAGMTALSALLVTGLLSGAMALVAKPADFGIDNTLTLAATIAAGAFGADLVMELDAEVDSTFSLGMFPLTVTLIALVVAVFVFRRFLRDYRSPYAALGDAARAALIFGLGLLIPALIFRSDNDETGRGWGRAISEDEFGAADCGSYRPSAFFLGFLIFFIVLALVVLVRSEWRWTGFGRVQAWVSAPLLGHATTFALLPVAGLVGWLLLGFGEDSIAENDPTGDDLKALVTLIFGLLASGGVWLVSIGAGAAVGYDAEATDEPDETEWQHLWGRITEDEPGLWAAPAVMLAILVVSALVVKHKSPADEVLRNLLLWAGSLLGIVPLLVRLSGAHFVGEASYLGEDYEFEAYFGAHGVQATFYLTGIAVVVAVLVAALTGNLNVAKLRSDVTTGLRRLQASPAQSPASGSAAPSHPPPSTPPPPAPPPTPGP
jgi:hypothetical protein